MKYLLLSLIACHSVFAVTAGKVWRISTGATKPAWGPVNLADATNAITGLLPKANIAAVGQQVSASSGNFTTTSTSYVDVTNLSVSITSTGRPVILLITSDAAGSAASIGSSASSSTGPMVTVNILRDATTTVYEGRVYAAAGAALISSVPPSIIALDAVAAGTYAYKVQLKSNAGTVTANVLNSVLKAYEM